MDRAAGREVRRVAAGDEVDRDHVGHQRDVRMLGRRGFERLLDRLAGRVGDMDDAAVAVPALAGQMQRIVLASRTERRARSDAGSRAAPPRRHARRPRRSLRPAPAIIVSLTCASKLSPSSSTAAIPPCAQRVAPSPSAPLAITATLCVSARLSAAVSPAAPEPTIRTSAVVLHAASCVGRRQAEEHVLEVGIAGRDVDDREARRRSATRSTCPAFTLSLR